MPARVLIVDDHAGFRSAARTLLEAEGFDVVAESATGGEELVLLDIGLPDVDGIEVAGRLCARRKPPAVVLTSSRDSADYRPLIERSGARGFIPKSELCGERLAALAA